MKAILTAVALTIASVGAFAQEATTFDDRFVSQKTRAEVRAEVMSALAGGEMIRSGEASYVASAPSQPSTRTRAEVRAEVMAALSRGDALRYGEAPPAGNYDLVHSGGSSTVLARTGDAPATR